MNAKQHIANALVHLINGEKDKAQDSFNQAIIIKSRPFVNEAFEKKEEDTKEDDKNDKDSKKKDKKKKKVDDKCDDSKEDKK